VNTGATPYTYEPAVALPTLDVTQMTDMTKEFDPNWAAKEEEKKRFAAEFGRNYANGKYKTTVTVYEIIDGKVFVTPYTDKGFDMSGAVELVENTVATHEGEIK